MPSALRNILPAVLAVALLIAPVTMGKAQESEETVFSEVIEVNVVNVAVTVTDKQGNPALGLTADDFEVLEDGKPVTVSNFYTVEAGEPPSKFVQAETRPTWVPLEDIEPTTPAEEASQRFIAVFIDNNHLEKRNRKKVFQGLRDFVHGQLDDNDRIMVSSFHDDFEVVQDFTASQGDVVMAVDRLEKAPAEGTRNEEARRSILRNLSDTDLAPPIARAPAGFQTTDVTRRARVESATRTLFFRIEQEAQKGHERAQRTINALAYLMSSMAGLPGRKAIVYVSDGLPLRPAETLYHAHFNRFSNAAEVLEFDFAVDPPEVSALKWDLTNSFEALVRHAQANQITFNAIDAAGQRSQYSMSAELDYRDPDSMAMAEMKPIWDARLDTLRNQNLESSVQMMADGTGGAVLINNRDYEGFFERVNRNLRNYYSLGYQAPHPKQGEIHKIDVRLRDKERRKELKLSFQEAYHDKTWNMRLTDMVISKLLHGVGKNDLEVTIVPGREEPKEKGKYVVPIQIGVPSGKLMLVPGANDRHNGRVSVVVVVKAPSGATSPPQMIPLEVKLTRAQVSSSPTAVAEVNLLVEGGTQTIGVGVRDELSGETATEAVAVTVPGNAG